MKKFGRIYRSFTSYISYVFHIFYSDSAAKPENTALFFIGFYPRDAMLCAGNSDRNVSVRLSVCLSVTNRYCVKTKKASVMISSPDCQRWRTRIWHG